MIRIPVPRWFGHTIEVDAAHFLLLWVLTLAITKYWNFDLSATFAIFISLFFSILVHEIGHVLGGFFVQVKTLRIFLSAWGGCTYFSRSFYSPTESFFAVGGGLLASFIFALLALLFNVTWLAYINFALILFNSIPFLPFDGGQLLESIIWLRTRNRLSAQRIAGHAGVLGSFLFGFLGIAGFAMSLSIGFTGLLLSYLLLQEGKQAIYIYRLYHYLKAVKLAEFDKGYSSVLVIDNPSLKISDFVRIFLAKCSYDLIVPVLVKVCSERYMWLSVVEIASVQRDQWNKREISEYLLTEPVHIMSSSSSFLEAVCLLARSPYLLVKDDSKILGLLQDRDIIEYLGIKMSAVKVKHIFQRLHDLMLIERGLL